jgi:hypothetical protein
MYTPTSNFTRFVAQPLMLAGLIACLLGSVLVLVEATGLGFEVVWLIPVVFGVALLGIYTTYWLHDLANLRIHRFAYRAAEGVVILLVVRLLTWWVGDSWPQVEGLSGYYARPWELLQDSLFWVATIFSLFAWERGISLAELFHLLALDPAEIAYYTENVRHRTDYQRPLAVHRTSLAEQFRHFWFFGGIAVITCVALVSVDWRDTAVSEFASLTNVGLPSFMVWLVIGYFLLGLALLSQVRLAMLNARWLIAGARKTSPVDAPWTRYTALLLLVIGGVAAFLPLGSTSLIYLFLTALLQLFYWLIYLVMGLVFGLLGWALSRAEDPEAYNPAPYQPQPPFVPPSVDATEPVREPLISFLFGATFWTIISIAIIAAVLFFLRERGIRLDWPWLVQLWGQIKQGLRGWWRTVKAQTGQWQEELTTAVAHFPTKFTPSNRRFRRTLHRSPRDKLRYFFLSTAHRAQEKGVARPPSATPSEYANQIKETWATTAPDLDPMTEAFLRAEYSPHEINPDEVAEAQAHWQAVRRQLRRPPSS